MRRFILVAIVPLLALWDGGMSLSSHLTTINGRPRAVGVGVAGNALTSSSSSSLSWEAAKEEASRLASDRSPTPTLRFVPREVAKAQANLVARGSSRVPMPLLAKLDKALMRGAPGRVEELITPVPGPGCPVATLFVQGTMAGILSNSLMPSDRVNMASVAWDATRHGRGAWKRQGLENTSWRGEQEVVWSQLLRTPALLPVLVARPSTTRLISPTWWRRRLRHLPSRALKDHHSGSYRSKRWTPALSSCDLHSACTFCAKQFPLSRLRNSSTRC